MKILILGSSGILGSSLYNELKKKHKIYHTGLKKRKKDILNEIYFKKLFKYDLDLVINCCAITDIDFAEKNKKIANKINYLLVKKILQMNKINNFHFINFSTDQVYNNKNYLKNTENNISFDGNYYTKTKIKSDKLTKKYKFTNLRINFFGKSYGSKGTFSDWIITKAKKKEKINLFSDQYISPLSLTSLSKIVKKIISKRIYGTYNLGSKGYISKKHLALKLLTHINKKLIIDYNSVKVNNFLKIRRSNYMVMNSKKFEKDFKIKLPKIVNEIKKVSYEYK